MDCNKTKVFFKELDRMCNSFLNDTVRDCPIRKSDVTDTCQSCENGIFEHPEEAIQIVQKWSDENPIKIDWTKVPIGTPVNVREFDNDLPVLRFFVCYPPRSKNNRFVTFDWGKTQCDADGISGWEYCELGETVDPMPYLEEV